MSARVKLAYLMAGACGGCDMSVVDISDTLLDVLPRLEIVFWAPTVADVKYKDLEAMPDQSVDVGFVSGMVRMSEQEHMTRVMRAKCKVLIAFGACATMGGIPGLANLHTREEIFQTAYRDTFSTDNPDGVTPQTSCTVDGKYELTLPSFYNCVMPIDRVVKADYYIGGCPPHHSFVTQAVTALLSGQLPPPGSWITGGKAACDVCERNPARQGLERTPVESVRRTTEGEPAANACLLQEGYICLGPVTQGDCGALCPKVNMPCRGCGGPIPGVKDFGLRAVSAVGALLARPEMVDEIASPAKLFYRYSLPASLLGKKVE